MTKRRSLLPAISSAAAAATTSSNNRNNAHYARRRRRLLALQLLLSHGTHSNKMGVASACKFYYSMSCQGGYPYKATNTLTIKSSGSYEATVTYHWTKANTQLGTISLNDQQTLDDQTYKFFELGEYYAGATIEWGSGSGCEGSSGDSYSLITFSGSSCDMIDRVTPPDDLLEDGMTLAPGGSSGTGGTAEPTSGGTQVSERNKTNVDFSVGIECCTIIECNNLIPIFPFCNPQSPLACDNCYFVHTLPSLK